jgi:hypothetical protein
VRLERGERSLTRVVARLSFVKLLRFARGDRSLIRAPPVR